MKIAIMMVVAVLAVSVHADAYYTESPVYQSRPPINKEMALDCIGATGIKARFYPGVVLKVEGVLAGSPAEGKLAVGQVLTGVNGVAFKGINAIVALGRALTAAEATDGKLVFDVQDDERSEPRQVEITIPVLGAYSGSWPLDCEKSQRIIEQAATYYAKNPEFRHKYFGDKSEDGGMPSALACLFLLSTGNDQVLPVVTYIWWKDNPHYRKLMMSANEVAHLQPGTNTLAVMAGSDYMKGNHVGQIDLYLEGLRKRDLLGE